MDPNPDLFVCVLLGCGPCGLIGSTRVRKFRYRDVPSSLNVFVYIYTITLHTRSAERDSSAPDLNPDVLLVCAARPLAVCVSTRVRKQIQRGISFTFFLYPYTTITVRRAGNDSHGP